MNRHPNLALFGGNVIIAMMVIAAFVNVANAGDCSYSQPKSAKATIREIKVTPNQNSEVEF